MASPSPEPSSRTHTWAILAVLAVAAYIAWLVLRPFLNVLAWAVVMTVLFFPLHRRLAQRLGRPGLAAACSTLLVIVTVLLPTALIVTATVNEVRAMTTGMPATVGEWLDLMPGGDSDPGSDAHPDESTARIDSLVRQNLRHIA